MWIRLLEAGQIPKLVLGQRSGSDFWEQVFQVGDLDRIFKGKCVRMTIWIGLLEAGQLPKIIPKPRSGSDFWEQVFQDGGLHQTFGNLDGDLDPTFGSRAAPRDSSRTAVWIGLLGAAISKCRC